MPWLVLMLLAGVALVATRNHSGSILDLSRFFPADPADGVTADMFETEIAGSRYQVTVGVAGPQGTLHGVYLLDQQGGAPPELMFTYVEQPGGGRSLLARNAEASRTRVEKAIADFGFARTPVLS